MAQKTFSVSVEAYNALKSLKMEGESFSEVILRLSQRLKVGKLSDLIKKIAPDEELADNVEKTSKRLRKVGLRRGRGRR